MSSAHFKGILVCTVLGTGLALMSGCGADSKQQKQRIGSTIPANRAQYDKKTGKPITKTSSDGGGNLAVDKNASTEITNIDNSESQLQTATTISRDKLAAGTYKLTTVNSAVNVLDSKKMGAEIRAIDTVQADDGAQFAFGSPNSQAAGAISSFTDSGRNVDIPIQFDVTQPWTPNRATATNVVLNNTLTSNAGSYTLKDEAQSPQDLQASLLKILAGTPSSDGVYSGKGENGVAITVKIMNVDNSTVRFMMSFSESAASSAKTTTADSLTFTRNIYLDYSVSSATPAATETQQTTEQQPATTETETTPQPQP